MDPEPQFDLIRYYKFNSVISLWKEALYMGNWQCEKREFCKARIHTKGTQIIKRTTEHFHDSDMKHVRSMKVKNEKEGKRE